MMKSPTNAMILHQFFLTNAMSNKPAFIWSWKCVGCDSSLSRKSGKITAMTNRTRDLWPKGALPLIFNVLSFCIYDRLRHEYEIDLCHSGSIRGITPPPQMHGVSFSIYTINWWPDPSPSKLWHYPSTTDAWCVIFYHLCLDNDIF